ncbi:helix-turn-helix domain-containing protein [Enterobacter vonholyi]|uniref:helix-turn-helix transcriptional regulator n=1 Tax=Enterobacteriaceae TaxID=543 RepID=UPI001118CA2E|nr:MULTISPECIES: helix-turn-helix domain-containing protein [Enterobacteriaceae]EFC2636671.1 helix-turn-helix domain-containing protein [Escherichia coli]MCL5636011.1 helix-turn-helix domain-containing protein [Enterobacter vonholyi]MDD8260921.1 helix-turn-helix domain-containing protein [Escherichia coli]QCZ25604.1 helix-turn-helix domain-containing protein [Leclercia adecarboxylata]HAW2807184.1 helix-turn-helix domain-containing protein [Escherichia coli]
MYINSKQLALRWGVSPSSIASDITRNPAKLPPFIRLGRAIRFPVAEVEAWEKQQLTNIQIPR